MISTLAPGTVGLGRGPALEGADRSRQEPGASTAQPPSINLRAGARSRGQRGQRSVFKLENCAVTYDTRHRPK